MKQETIEEVAKIVCHTHKTPLEQANEIVKLLQERSYSENEMLDITKQAYSMGRSNYTIKAFNEWFEQFKKQQNA